MSDAMGATESHQGPDAVDDTIPGPVRTVLAVLVFTAFVMILNETTLAVAMPAIMADYAITAATAQWVLTGFMLTMAVVLPGTGWVLERFSTRSVFIFAVGIFLVGTFTAALAPSYVVLLIARSAQAVGTAITMPLLMTVAMTLVPPRRRGAVMGLIGAVMVAGPALGPTVAGFILGFSTWHAIFWFMVPLVAVAGVVGAARLRNVSQQRSTPFDLLSVFLSVFAFGGLVYGLSSVGTILEGGPTARLPLVLFAVGVVGLGLFVWRQLARGRHDQALLDLRPLAVRNFTLPLIVLLCMFGVVVGVTSLLPLYLQGSVLVTALASGLALLPGGVVEGLLSPVAGRFYDRYGPRPLIIPGVALSFGSLSWLLTVDQNTSLAVVILIHVIFSIGLAMVFTPVMTTALGSLPQHLYSHGSAILNTAQQLAAAFGTATMITVYSNVAAAAQSDGVPAPVALASGATTAFLLATGFTAVAVVLSLFVRPVPVGLQDRGSNA